MKNFVGKIKNKMILTTLLLCMVMCMSLLGLSTAVSAEIVADEPGDGTMGTNTLTTLDLQLNTQIQIVSFGGHTYQLFDTGTTTTWSSAKSLCEDLGGHLVTITSAEEQQQLYNSFHKNGGIYWIGCYADQSKAWHWVSGAGFNYNNWCEDEPTDWIGGNCRGAIYMYPGKVYQRNNKEDSYDVGSGQWAFLSDAPSGYFPGFICEWDNQSISIPDASSSLEPQELSMWADPIDTSTGAHVINLSYLKQYGAQTFSFDLGYDSSRLCEGELGVGWHHNYEKKIVPQNNGTLFYYTSPSIYVPFVYNGHCYTTNMAGKLNWWIDDLANGEYLVNLGVNGQEKYNADGELIQIISHTGETLNISRSGQSLTISETISGKSLTIAYDAQGRISNVSGATPTETGTGSVQFTYDENNHLTAITGPDNKTIRYTYDTEGRVLSGKDGDEVDYFSDTYENGRVTTQVDGEGNTTSFSYVYPSTGNSVVTINDRNGNTVVQTYNEESRLIRTEDQDNKVKTYAYDFDGNITEETDCNGNTTVKTYNDNNQVLTETHPLNQTTYCTTHYTYDNKGNLTHQENPDGGDIFYTYRPNNQVATYTDEREHETTYAYNLSNLLTEKTLGNSTTSFTYEDGKADTITDPEGGVTSYTYTASGMPAEITDANGNTVNYIYDAVGNLVQQTDQEGNETTFTYDSRGNVLSQTDGNGNTTRYTYNGNGKVISMIDAKNHVTYYIYDDEDRLTGTEDPQGNIEHRTYTPAGLLKTVTDEMGNITKYRYDGVGNVLTEKKPRGGITTKTYDANNNIASETDPAGNTTTYAYDSMNRLTTETNANGKVTTYAYDLAGNLVSIADPLGHTTSYTYDVNGNQLTVTDPRGYTTSYTYDGNNNLTSMTDALNNVTTYAYDAAGRLTGMTDAKNHTTTYAYDRAGHITGTTDALGNTTAVGYDANGNITSTTDGRGYTTNYTYDKLNLQTSSTDSLNNTTQNTFDSLGRLVGTTTPVWRRTFYTYDKSGNMLDVSDLMGNMSSQAFDADGNAIAVTNPNGQSMGDSGALITRYDTSDRKISKTATGSDITYGYNSLNVLSEYTNGRGQQTTLTYDDAGRLISAVSVDGTVSYTYDANGNVLTVTNSEGTIIRSYDALNRVMSCTDTRGNTITYSYDEVGNLETIGYPDGDDVNYTYDAVNQMKTVTDSWDYTTTYTYDAAGNLIRTERPDGSVLTETYNAVGYLTSMEDVNYFGQVISGYSYTYNEDGDMIEERSEKTQTIAINTPTYAIMTYDDAGRLTERSVCECQQNMLGEDDYLVLDAAGNITEVNNSVSPVDNNYYFETDISMVYGWHNHLCTYDGELVSYDHDGNMIDGPLGQMSYDSQNRLTQAGGESYTYDGENNRNSSTANGVTTTYTYDTTSSLSRMIMSETGTDTTYYIYGLGLIGSHDSSGYYSTYHYDYRGSTVAITNDFGELTDEYIYGTYGQLLQHTGDSDTPFLYNGRDGVMTDDNGLYYMRARYYSPELMRFINADPLTQSIAEDPYQNVYAYANGNPISYIDPFGTSAELSKSEAWHMLLDMGGMAYPVFDFINGAWYVYTGDWTNAAWSTFAIIPVAGDISKVPKVGKDVKIIGEVIDAATGGSAILDASKAASKATENIDSFIVSNKHLSGAGGNWSKFNTNNPNEVNIIVKDALESQNAQFLSNSHPNSYKIITDMEKTIGTNGETKVQIIIGADGKIWTAYPIK